MRTTHQPGKWLTGRALSAIVSTLRKDIRDIIPRSPDLRNRASALSDCPRDFACAEHARAMAAASQRGRKLLVPKFAPRLLQTPDEENVERVLVVDFVSRKRSTTTRSLSRARGATRAALKPTELRLVRWLENHLSCAGAAAMVVKYGARKVLNTLYSQGIVQWNEYTHPKPGDPRRGYSTINPELHRPAGFLRWALDRGL